MNVVYHANALSVLARMEDDSVDLVYCDPPFGTGHKQALVRRKAGEVMSFIEFDDPNTNYIEWLRKHVEGLHRVLKLTGTLYLHLDHHWVHRAKVMCDEVFGPECFLNEVIWAYDFGGRGKDRWPRKHDNILVYVKEAGKHVFNWDAIPRVPYKAPEMQRVGRSPEEAEERIALGKVPTDVWDIGIIGTNAKERNGYPTQKPRLLVERAVLASSPPGGHVIDVFAGSGTTGEAAYINGRSFTLADTSPWAIEVMQERFKGMPVEWHGCRDGCQDV
jgi:site-specific DNA-methyltransferase (adenine-specific)